MADFTTSSHRDRWFFTAKDLDKMRLTAYQRALQTLDEHGCSAIEASIDGYVMYRGTCEKGTKKRTALPEPLTVDDESLMRVYYENLLLEVCKVLQLPHTIKEAAIIYLKRFYLLWSIMEHHPKPIMMTCVFIACKNWDSYIGVEHIFQLFKIKEDEILGNEMLIYKSLNFDIIVYGPYRSIDPLVSDMEEFEVSMKVNLEDEIDKLMLTDAPLIFPPGQLALAALKRVSGQIRAFDFERYLRSLCSQLQTNHSYSEMVESLDAINALMETAKMNPSREEMQPIDRKLTRCRKDQGSKHEKSKRHKPNPQTNEGQ
jgi:cyclin H